MALYEVAVIKVVKEKDKVKKEVLVMAPTAVCAHEPQIAVVRALQTAKLEIEDDMQVLVRPFA